MTTWLLAVYHLLKIFPLLKVRVVSGIRDNIKCSPLPRDADLKQIKTYYHQAYRIKSDHGRQTFFFLADFYPASLAEKPFSFSLYLETQTYL